MTRKEQLAPHYSLYLDRLELEAPAWLTISCQLEDTFSGPIGTPIAIVDFAEQCQYGRTPNVTNATRYLM